MDHQVFDEFEAYAESIQDGDVRSMLSVLEVPQWSIHHINPGSLHLQIGNEGGGNFAEGATRRDGWVLYMQTSGGWCLANGTRMSANSIFVMPPGCQFSLPSVNAHDWFTVYYPSECLFPAGVRTIESDRVGRVVRPGDEVAMRLASSVREFVRAAEIEPTVLSEQASIAAFQESLLITARHILGAARTPEEQHCPAVCRQELIASVVEFLGDCPQVMPTIKELAKNSGVSERTFRSAFQSQLGISPKKFLTIRRMHQARKLLMENEQDKCSVTSVAAKLGFWDFGRFAGTYRKLFNELPSQTLGSSFAKQTEATGKKN